MATKDQIVAKLADVVARVERGEKSMEWGAMRFKYIMMWAVSTGMYPQVYERIERNFFEGRI